MQDALQNVATGDLTEFQPDILVEGLRVGAENLAGTDPASFGKLLSFIKTELVPKYSASYIKDQL